jgi:hypothetical protein
MSAEWDLPPQLGGSVRAGAAAVVAGRNGRGQVCGPAGAPVPRRQLRGGQAGVSPGSRVTGSAAADPAGSGLRGSTRVS